MNGYVADTHALFWYLTSNPKLKRGGSGGFR